MRGGTDYTTLTDWATDAFAESYHDTFSEHVPEGTQIQGVQTILEMTLSSSSENEVRAAVCVDNGPLSLVTDEGEVLDTSHGPETSDGIIIFDLSADGTKLLVTDELRSSSESALLCDR